MKKIGIFKAMKLCMDYKKVSAEKQQQIREKRLKEIVEYARNNSPYYKNLYQDVKESFVLTEEQTMLRLLFRRKKRLRLHRCLSMQY